MNVLALGIRSYVGWKPTIMWAVSVPVTWVGLEKWLHGATTIVGFLTSLTGLLIGVLGVIYWLRKIKR